ncbi:MAG TPA: hypothetical protein VNK92_01190 [Vicinamibacterales bacterium]|nr:hypothetical protein [Vicinamibacterales bacterium]
MPKVKFVVAAVAPVLLLGAFASGGAAQSEVARHAVIPQPPDWVAFEAEVEYLTVPGKPAIPGRLYRARDGSRRVETGDPVTVVSIHNIPRVTYFVYSAREGWTARPMILPPEGWRPRQYRADSRSLSKEREPYLGFEVYRLVSADGTIELRAPALNFEPLVRQSARDGTRIVLKNIRLVEPDPSLFEPPAGASVRYLSEPGGIVFSSK